MELYISFYNNSKYNSELNVSSFVIKFYWFEKNRVFEINKNDFQIILKNFLNNNSTINKYQYYFKLPSIVEGKYRFFSSGSPAFSLFNLKLIYNNSIIYESDRILENHTFSINKQLTNKGIEYTTTIIDPVKFMKDEKTHRIEIITRSIKRWNYYWYNIHYFLNNYYPLVPLEYDKTQVLKLINVMSSTGIPCVHCRQHFKSYLQINPINQYLSSRESLKKYFIDLHNDINKRNKKNVFSYEGAEKKYKKNEEFEIELKKISVPLFVCYLEGRIEQFPNILLNYSTL